MFSISTKEEQRNLANVVKVLPDLLRMEQTRLLVRVLARQWGIANISIILLKTIKSAGIVRFARSITRFKLDGLIPHLMISLWETLGTREAIIVYNQDGKRIKAFSYEEFKERVLRLANGLQGLGIQPNDRIAVFLHNQAVQQLPNNQQIIFPAQI